MSYSIWIGEENFGYTRNLGPFFRDFIEDEGKGGGLDELEGLTGQLAGEAIGRAFRKINEACRNTREDTFLKKYNAPNGFGSTYSATLFLGQVMRACFEYPDLEITLYK